MLRMPTSVLGSVINHGLRRDRADMDEWFRILFAASGSEFPDDVTPHEFPKLIRDTALP